MAGREVAVGCSIVFFIISSIGYVITIGVGWGLQNSDIEVDTDLLYRGTIAMTIPAVAILLLCIIGCVYGMDGGVIRTCSMVLAIVLAIFAGVIELVGAIIYIVGTSQLDNLRDGSKPEALPYGVAASIFGLITALSCCLASCCFCGAFVNDQEENSEA